MVFQDYRQDPLTGIWVIISENRNKRPDEFNEFKDQKLSASYMPNCYFCPGNEDKTPPEILAYRNCNVWWARAVLNKFPALSLEAKVNGSLSLIREGMFVRAPGYGVHEVIIETQYHNQDIQDRTLEQVREMFWMYRDRLSAYKDGQGLENALIFKNKGRDGGASQEHPHSQLTASPVPMQRLNIELEGAEKYFLSENFMGKKEQCVCCDTNSQELEKAIRLIGENDYFIAFMPYASRFPFETWISPKKHNSNYSYITPEEATNLAIITKDVFQKLHKTLRNFDYNMILHTTPLNSSVQEFYHWHIEIIPRLTKIAGFELGSGNYINILSPERAAQFVNSQ